jgi:hypothetical protein
MMRAVLALGLTQITAWGTAYYCLGVLAAPISRDTGWSRGFVVLGFTVRCSRWALSRASWVARSTAEARGP